MTLFSRRAKRTRWASMISTPTAMAELELLADEALKTAHAIKHNVALLRAQDQVRQSTPPNTQSGGTT